MPILPYYPGHVFRTLGFSSGINEKNPEASERFKGAKNRYLFHAHECRDSLVSLSEVKSNIVCGKFITAHSIDNYRYNKSPWKDPEHFKELYSKMSPWLNVVSCDPEKIKLQKKIETIKIEKDKRIAKLEADNSTLISALQNVDARLAALEKPKNE